ncbi:MAG: hypothetical protein IKK85_00815, partial [Clostridia bacterium]|nr:hypothetical protein [Clostridia bacterium]
LHKTSFVKARAMLPPIDAVCVTAFCFAQIYFRTVKNAKIKLECVRFNIVSFQKFLPDETCFLQLFTYEKSFKKAAF